MAVGSGESVNVGPGNSCCKLLYFLAHSLQLAKLCRAFSDWASFSQLRTEKVEMYFCRASRSFQFFVNAPNICLQCRSNDDGRECNLSKYDSGRWKVEEENSSLNFWSRVSLLISQWCFPFSVSESERMATLTKPQLTTRLMDWDMLWLQLGGESSIIWSIVSLLCHLHALLSVYVSFSGVSLVCELL